MVLKKNISACFLIDNNLTNLEINYDFILKYGPWN